MMQKTKKLWKNYTKIHTYERYMWRLCICVEGANRRENKKLMYRFTSAICRYAAHNYSLSVCLLVCISLYIYICICMCILFVCLYVACENFICLQIHNFWLLYERYYEYLIGFSWNFCAWARLCLCMRVRNWDISYYTFVF